MPDMEKALEIDQAIAASSAIRAFWRIQALEQSLYIFRRNHEDLKNALDLATDPEKMLPLWDTDRRPELNALLTEIRRLLHNFVAAAMTLVDQTRVIIRRAYDGHPFFDRYTNEVALRFLRDPTANFVHALRNYMLHYTLPATFSNLSMAPGTDNHELIMETKITLDRTSLLRWERWPQPARDMLANKEDDLDLEEIVETYATTIYGFHAWLAAELSSIHAEELAWLDDMFRQLAQARGDPMPPHQVA